MIKPYTHKQLYFTTNVITNVVAEKI